MDGPRIVLASASPRRRALLSEAGVEFDVQPADVDETIDAGAVPEEAAVELALRKAEAARLLVPRGATLLAADTVVAVDVEDRSRLLGKPEDAAEARRMLGWLSGSRHRVVTGLCALCAPDGPRATAWERTWVTMRPITAAEIDGYVASGEWRDKAGGYAIQETADRFVTALEEGGFDNVVGLPVELALDLLARVGVRGGAGGL